MFEGALEIERREESFADIVELEDSKRIPLNSRDRDQRKGPYPYYGATSIMGYVDDFLFDGTRILLGEDGSVITDDGRPVLQYVWGKYWVNNHAHILKPSAEYSLEMLYIALNRTSIPHIVTGAVQKKISQKNLNTLVLEMPNPQHMEGLGEIFSLYRANVDQNKQLERLRDTLLPKLMSGEIDVSQVELPTLPNNHLTAASKLNRSIWQDCDLVLSPFKRKRMGKPPSLAHAVIMLLNPSSLGRQRFAWSSQQTVAATATPRSKARLPMWCRDWHNW